jgi:3-phenylpropionate/trans-cinnamate dioxygenase ferredoxin reductase subunit
MSDQQTFVIIGANLAGGRAAFALRTEGFAGRIVLIGAEPDPPYERPPLSKEYLRGDVTKEKLYIAAPEVYEDRQIDLLVGTLATAIDTTKRIVEVEGAHIEYDKLLLATGAYPRKLDAPGSDLEGIYDLRTIADSERIREELEPERSLVVIGAGFIGAEIAASARMKGLDVTVIEALHNPLIRALGDEMGGIMADIHRERGVRLHTNESIDRFEGGKRVERVLTRSGRAIDCDFAVVGVGVVPATELAEAAGLQIDNGIVVNEYCETSAPDVYACGDVANFYHPLLGHRLRVEHWSNAQNQAIAAAKSMMGVREPYDDIPWFWSDQYDLNIQYVGHATKWDEVVLRGDVLARRFSAFYIEAGKLRAALTVNRHRDIRPARELIRQGVPVESGKLKDEEVELKSLVPVAP